MRVRAHAPRDFEALAISGIRTVLIALNCPESRRVGLKGFAFQRERVASGSQARWLRSLKVFKSIVPDPKTARDPQDPTKPARFYTNDFPIQSFLWGDYAADPDTVYRYRILPRYGQPGQLTTDPRDEIMFEVRTEKEFDGTHGVWFNRGAIASQKYAEEFGNLPPQNVDDPKDRRVAWLSRGLLEACLTFINDTPASDALRVAAYEFTYAPVLNALAAARTRGVDVQIVYHDTSAAKTTPNETAMTAAGLPVNDRKVTFRRTKTKIPHNKFIVRLKDGQEPVEVWTGSTNFTPSGFLGQTNVGHRIADPATAQQYLDYWKILKKDPELTGARKSLAALTPHPIEVISPQSVVRVFSPRAKAEMLSWYGRRMLNAANCVCLTAAFGVTTTLVAPIAQRRDQMRFLLLEKPPSDALRKELNNDFTHLIPSYGVPLGELYTMKNGKPTARKRIAEFELDKWFFKEEHYRPKNSGFVFFVHTKFLLIDPLSDDPLVCSGSANFSPASLLQNDENMLLIRGNTRVADIYLTEFDRIFRHFYFRDIANELAAKGTSAKSAFLDESVQSEWTDGYFKPNRLKTNRRLMFFAQPGTTWFANAGLPAKTAVKKAAKKKSGKSVIKKRAARPKKRPTSSRTARTRRR
jgi:phosphatidylserine/phosphatidylglycerophosphate/cardiolipin synthase-like enzyme